MSKTAKAADVNLQIARALGLSTEHLAGVRVDLVPGQLPRVVAEYHLRNPDGLVKALETLEIGPRATPQEQQHAA